MELTRQEMSQYTQQLMDAFAGQESVSWRRMGRIVKSDDFLGQLRMTSFIQWEGGRYWRGAKWLRTGELSLDRFINLLSKNKGWQLLPDSIPIDGQVIILKEQTLPVVDRTDLTLTIRISVKGNRVMANVEWNSLLDWKTVRQLDDDQSEELYEQEYILLVRNEACPITELQDDIVEKVSSFFDHQFPVTIVRKHGNHKRIKTIHYVDYDGK